MPSRRGFTLIELMVVMVVVATVTAVVAVGLGNIRDASVQAEAGKLAVAVRYLYNLSVLNGKVYRLTLDLDSGTWWGEEQASRDPCKSFELAAEGEQAADSGHAGQGGKGAKGGEAAGTGGPDDGGEGSDHEEGSFGATKTRLLKKRKLAKGIIFSGVMTSHQSELAVEGRAHIHFFPNGTAERALIFLRVKDDEEDEMTVEILPLQGSARIHLDRMDLDEFFDQE